jgi:CBS domain-containing protein
MKVSGWLAVQPNNIVTVAEDMPVDSVIERLLREPCLRDVYVVDREGHLVGHISHKRLAEHLLSEQRPAHTRRQLMERVAGGTAKDFMNPSFTTAAPREELEDVLNRQLEMEIEDMPVLDREGKVVGAINLTNVLREYMRAVREKGGKHS